MTHLLRQFSSNCWGALNFLFVLLCVSQLQAKPLCTYALKGPEMNKVSVCRYQPINILLSNNNAGCPFPANTQFRVYMSDAEVNFPDVLTNPILTTTSLGMQELASGTFPATGQYKLKVAAYMGGNLLATSPASTVLTVTEPGFIGAPMVSAVEPARPICVGGFMKVEFNLTDCDFADHMATYKVFLSDAQGNFNQPRLIANMYPILEGFVFGTTFYAPIPFDVPAGGNYKIRLVSSYLDPFSTLPIIPDSKPSQPSAAFAIAPACNSFFTVTSPAFQPFEAQNLQPSAAQPITLSKVDPSQALTLNIETLPTLAEFSTQPNGTFTQKLALNWPAGQSILTVYVRLPASNYPVPTNATVTFGAFTVIQAKQYDKSDIAVLAMDLRYKGPSVDPNITSVIAEPNNLTFSGPDYLNLYTVTVVKAPAGQKLQITAPTGYELTLPSPIAYSDVLTLDVDANGSLYQYIQVRLKNNLPNGTYTGQITNKLWPSNTPVAYVNVNATVGPVNAALQLITPTYNCTSGAFTFQTTGGNGSPIEFKAIGITDWNANPNQFVDSELRTAADAAPILLHARQSGQEVSYSWNIRAQCPVGGNPPAPGGNTLQLVAPIYNCASGAFTFQTTGDNGSTVEFKAIGITDWNSNPNQFVDVELRTAADAAPILLWARQNGQVITYLWDIRALCPVGGNPPAPGGSTLQLVAPVYNCTSGAFTFQTTGGNGAVIEFRAIGITDWSTNPNQFVDTELRTAADAAPILLRARQSGQEVSYSWNIRAQCPVNGARQGISTEKTPELTVVVLENPLTNNEIELEIKGAENQPVRMELFDTQGRSITERNVAQAQSLEHQTINVSNQPSGILLLRVSGLGRSKVIRIIKP
ncbi:hypothetical protein GCM10028807_51530 [Spirosoma daeguense]